MTFTARVLGVGLGLSVLVATAAGCPGIQTVNTVQQHLNIQVIPGGSYSGYSGTSFSESIPSSKKVTLLSATLSSDSGEFSWAKSLVGTAGDSESSPVLLEKTSFAGATSPTDLDVAYTGDLLPLYPTQDFRVYWAIQFASDPAQSYPNGVNATVSLTFQIE